MTELVPTPSIEGNVRKALIKPKATVSDVLKAAKPQTDVVELAQTPLPKDPSLNEDAFGALERIASQLAELRLPDRRRVLTQPELEQLTRTYSDLQDVLSGLNGSREQIKAAAFNHFDAVAAEDGKITVDTQHTKEGWAVVEDKESAVVKGLDVKLTREVSGGKLDLTVEGLRDLVEDEKLDQADLLAITRQTRVVDEARALEWMRKNPGRAHLLVEASTVGRSTASFHIRKND